MISFFNVQGRTLCSAVWQFDHRIHHCADLEARRIAVPVQLVATHGGRCSHRRKGKECGGCLERRALTFCTVFTKANGRIPGVHSATVVIRHSCKHALKRVIFIFITTLCDRCTYKHVRLQRDVERVYEAERPKFIEIGTFTTLQLVSLSHHVFFIVVRHIS